MIINSLIKQGSKILKKQNIDSHQIDAELLLSKAIRKDRVFLLTNDEYKVSQKETSDYLNFILRRKHHEPLSYIIKRKEFWSLGFNVNHNVLIPRPETETIVEQVVRRFKGKGSLNILDIGTGSGCILLSILKELKNSYGISVSTVEHLMAAFYGEGIDNVLVEIDAPEIPIMDGSAFDFVEAIRSVGTKKQNFSRKFILKSFRCYLYRFFSDTINWSFRF